MDTSNFFFEFLDSWNLWNTELNRFEWYFYIQLPSGKLTCWPWKSPILRGNSSSNPVFYQGPTVNLLEANYTNYGYPLMFTICAALRTTFRNARLALAIAAVVAEIHQLLCHLHGLDVPSKTHEIWRKSEGLKDGFNVWKCMEKPIKEWGIECIELKHGVLAILAFNTPNMVI